MKITVINVGRVRQNFVLEGEREYLKRMSASAWRPVLLELAIDAPDSLHPDEIRHREGFELLRRLSAYDVVVALDERGQQMSSREFADFLQQQMTQGKRSLAFLIGGAHGFSEAVRQSASKVLSLSQLTLPHQLTRLVLVEQLYRAHTLIQGTGYHK